MRIYYMVSVLNTVLSTSSYLSTVKPIYSVSSVDSYEKAWDRIREITGEEEVDLLVHRFIEVEDRNFALFNYVNEQHNEIELLHEQIQQVRSRADNTHNSFGCWNSIRKKAVRVIMMTGKTMCIKALKVHSRQNFNIFSSSANNVRV